MALNTWTQMDAFGGCLCLEVCLHGGVGVDSGTCRAWGGYKPRTTRAKDTAYD